MHQSKLCDDLVLVNVEPGVHEEVVHLHEGEDHVEDRVDAGEDVPRAAAHRNLEKLGETSCRNHLEEVDKLQPCVDKGAQSKGNRPKSDILVNIQKGSRSYLSIIDP